MTTAIEFEHSLDKELDPALWPRAAPLAALLADVYNEGLAPDEVRRRMAGNPGLAPVLKALANKEIKVNGASMLVAVPPDLAAAAPAPALTQDNRVAIILNKGSAGAITAYQHQETTQVSVTLSGTAVRAATPPEIVRCPAQRPPPEPMVFYDRGAEIRHIRAQIKPRHGAWLAGQPGSGMTSLLAKAVNGKAAEGFAAHDGVAYIDGWLEPREPDDLVQSVYNRFFMGADGSAVRLHPRAARAELGRLGALFVLDRPRLDAEQLGALARDLEGEGSVLVAADDSGAPWMAQVEVGPLPAEHARHVFLEAARLGDDATTAALADRIGAALDGLPLALTVAGRLVRAGRARDLEALATEAEALCATRPQALCRAAALVVRGLDEHELAALRAIVGALPAGGTLEAVAEIGGLEVGQAEVALHGLARLGVVCQGGERFSVATSSLRAALGRLLNCEAERKRAVPALAAAALARFGDGPWLAHEWVNLLQGIRTALASGQTDYAAGMLRAVQPHVAGKGLWETWGHVADLAQRAAATTGDTSLQAWALHEEGTRAGLLGDLDRARASLGRAHELRLELGDHVGAELTHSNMAFFGLLPPPVEPEPEPPVRAAGLTPGAVLPPIIATFVAVAAIAALLAALLGPFAGDDETPPTTAPAPPTLTISSPAVGQRFRPGEILALRGGAADAGQPLAPAALTWSVTLRSPEGERVLLAPTAGDGLSVAVPAQVDLKTAAGGYLEIVVAATGAGGLRAEQSLRLEAVSAPVELVTEPPGAPLIVNGESITTPYREELWSGVRLDLEAPATLQNAGRLLRFEGWSDGVDTPRRTTHTGDDGMRLAAVYGARIVSCARPTERADEGAATATLAVTLNKPATEPLTVGYAVEPLGAAAGGDFQLAPGSLTFAPGQAELPITARIVEDGVDEPDEALAIRLEPGDGVALGLVSRCELLIADNDEPARVAFAAPAYTVGEGAGSAELTLRLDGPSGFATTARLRVEAVSATPGADFTLAQPEVRLAPGAEAGAVSVAISDDQLFEGPERLMLVVEPLEHLRPGEPSVAYLTIVDNDTAPVVSLAAPGPVGEGAGEARLIVSSSIALPVPLEVRLVPGPGSATPGADVTLPASVTLPAGTRSLEVRVGIVQDNRYEGDEELELRIELASDRARLGQASATLRIVDDEQPATVSFVERSYTCNEPGGGGGSGESESMNRLMGQSPPGPCAIAVRLVGGGQPTGPISATVRVSGGTATPGADFVLAGDVATFEPDVTEVWLPIRIVADGLYERTEQAILELTTVPGGGVQPAGITATTLTINNVDAPPMVRLEYPEAVDETAGELVVAAVLDRLSGVDVGLVLATVSPPGTEGPSGRATPGEDYKPREESLTIKAGELRTELRVPIISDGLAEGPEALLVELRNVHEARPASPTTGMITIVEPAPQVGFAPASYSANEDIGGGYPGHANLVVRLSQAAAGPVTVSFTSVDGSAVAGEDYKLDSDSLTIAPGATEGIIDVTISYDRLYEGPVPETFQVVLTQAEGATIGEGTATVAITDSSAPPRVAFAQESYGLIEGQSQEITLILSGPSALPVTVDLAVGGSASQNQSVEGMPRPPDYTLSATQVVFAAGETTRSITLTAMNDDIPEGGETIVLSVADPALAAEPAVCTVTIFIEVN